MLARYAREGYAIVTAVPSCTLMFKQELPLMFPDDADVKAVQEAMFDPFEYLIARHKDGLLKTDFKAALGKVSYHVPCHGRVQKIGRKTEEMFQPDRPERRRRAQHGRALLRPRRHLRREDRDPPDRDEDRQAGVQGDGPRRRPTSSAPTARWPAITSRRAWRSTSCRRRRCAIRSACVRMAYGLE